MVIVRLEQSNHLMAEWNNVGKEIVFLFELISTNDNAMFRLFVILLYFIENH